jgi:cyclic pyranopterin phosphate synthase
MPPEGLPWIPKADILTYEETARIIRAVAPLGIQRLRITGGEPLIRRDLPILISMLSQIPGIKDIALSTNGIHLAEMGTALKEAGLKRVNVSLDTLRPDRFKEIARRPGLERVLEGLQAAEELGLHPIKVNTVVMRGINDDELPDFASLTLDHPWHVRLIEVMPLEDNLNLQAQSYISWYEMRQRLESLGTLEPVEGPPGNGPARYFRLPGGKGTIGVITPLSHNYCDRCNRVRLTADGRLRLCLFGDQEIDLRTPLRQGAGEDEIRRIFLRAMRIKPERHHLAYGAPSSALRALSQVGG